MIDATSSDFLMPENTPVPVTTTNWATVTSRFLEENAPHGIGEWYHTELETRIMAIPNDKLPEELQGNKSWNVSFPSEKIEA